jgi:hypothetical protein
MAHPAAGFGLDALFVPIRMGAANLACVHGAKQRPAARYHAQLFRGALAAQDVRDGVVYHFNPRGNLPSNAHASIVSRHRDFAEDAALDLVRRPRKHSEKGEDRQ